LRLLPPPEAARPGGYDFARDAYFKGIGAVGSVSGRLARIEPPPSPPGFSLRLAAAVDRARNVLTAEIARTIGGSAGAVSAALITGKRGLIDEHTNDILRAAGIYHIVSISGLHMVLAAGVFFWLTRALLALSPHLAQTWPIKKLAALAGMAGATGYCIFSGSDVATERSLIMILGHAGRHPVRPSCPEPAQPRALGTNRAGARARDAPRSQLADVLRGSCGVDRTCGMAAPS
jgi:competence protein ComEC